MARREEFSAGLLTVDVGIELPVYEEANFAKLKETLNDKLLISGSNRTISTAGLPTPTAEKAAEVKKRYIAQATHEYPNNGITVLGYIHGNRKTTNAAITTAAEATSRLITSIFDPRYKVSTFRVGTADTQTGANNSGAIGLYLLSYYVDEYYPSETQTSGRWEAVKYTLVSP